MSYKDRIEESKLPRHVAVIMDGNGRWAEKRGNRRVFGHKNGVEAVRNVVEASAELGLGFLTLYAFSTENWNRPKREINALMSLLVSSIDKETKTLMKNNVRLRAIGDLDSLPGNVNRKLDNAIDITSGNNGLSLILALSYSGRWEIINSVKKIGTLLNEKKISVSDIDEEMFRMHLSAPDIPDPELLIRTSGEYRISNFLLWQIAYTELFFTKKLWPDFCKEDLYEAIYDFQNRERRFGMTTIQINS